MRAGVYAEKMTIPGGANECCFYLDGTKCLTFRAYPGERPVLTYPVGDPPRMANGAYGDVVRFATCAPTVFDGLDFIGLYDAGPVEGPETTPTSSGITINPGTSPIALAVHNCTFSKARHAHVKFDGTVLGQVVIERNQFLSGGFVTRDHHIYISGWQNNVNTVIRHNVFTGSRGYAVHLYTGPDNVQIYGNLIFGNGLGDGNGSSGGGIVLGGRYHRVYNNTIVGNHGYAGLAFWSDYSISNQIYNNIIRENGTPGFDLCDVRIAANNAGPNLSGHNNWHTLISLASAGYDRSADVDYDPDFTSATPAAWTDYRLNAGSPMIGAGYLLDAPYNQVLDPSITDWPTPKTITSPVIGAFVP